VVASGALFLCNGVRAAEKGAILLRGIWAVLRRPRQVRRRVKGTRLNGKVRMDLYWTTAVSDTLRERAAGKLGTLILMGHS
jgi:hypothetical protein